MGCLGFFFAFFVFILCPYLKSFPALYPRLQQILEFGTWQANQSFFFLGVDQWDWRTGPLVSWPSPPSGPRPVVGFRGQEQEPETARVAKDRFGREKENNRYGHKCNFMKQDDLPLKLFWICMCVPISKYHVLFKSNKSSPCLCEKNLCGGYTDGCVDKR